MLFANANICLQPRNKLRSFLVCNPQVPNEPAQLFYRRPASGGNLERLYVGRGLPYPQAKSTILSRESLNSESCNFVEQPGRSMAQAGLFLSPTGPPER